MIRRLLAKQESNAHDEQGCDAEPEATRLMELSDGSIDQDERPGRAREAGQQESGGFSRVSGSARFVGSHIAIDMIRIAAGQAMLLKSLPKRDPPKDDVFGRD